MKQSARIFIKATLWFLFIQWQILWITVEYITLNLHICLGWKTKCASSVPLYPVKSHIHKVGVGSPAWCASGILAVYRQGNTRIHCIFGLSYQGWHWPSLQGMPITVCKAQRNCFACKLLFSSPEISLPSCIHSLPPSLLLL